MSGREGQVAEEYDLFVSYSSQDAGWVGSLIDALRAAGVRVWWDKDILAGEVWLDEIEKAIQACWAMVVVVSRASVKSQWVKEEYTRALILDVDAGRTRPIIPIKIDDTPIPSFLGNRQWFSFAGHEDFATRVAELAARLKGKHPILSDITAVETLPPLDRIIREAKTSLVISGHTLDKFSTDVRVQAALHSLFENGTKATLVLLNPFCNYAKAHEPFHALESRGSSQDQILRTIDVLRHMVAESSEACRNLNVLLTNYMPRFRTILVDDSSMYVSLYMYSEDVAVAPEMRLRGDDRGITAQWFRTIHESLLKLTKSTDIVHLVRNGRFNKEWQNTRIREMLIRCPEHACCRNPPNCWDEVKDVVLGYPGHRLNADARAALIHEDQEPGTHRLSEISVDCAFLAKPLPFDAWLRGVVADEMNLIRATHPDLLANRKEADVVEQLRRALSFKPPLGAPLLTQIWVQEYSDIIRRLLYTLLVGDPELDIDLYPALTTDREAFVREVVGWLERHRHPQLRDWLHLSVAAGLLGIDEKPSHAATSEIDSRRGIPLNKMGEDVQVHIHRVADSLWNAAKSPCRIDASEAFLWTMDVHQGMDASLVSFPDDYLETILLLRFYQELLFAYPRLRINCVPRSSKCSNDASFEDLERLRKLFPGLSDSPRFIIHPNGPKIGGVNPHKLHSEIVRLIDKAVAVDVRGARSYEMMQGMWPEVYFGFMVCREISESVTGFSSEQTPFVFIRQKGAQCSFEGFRQRRGRVKDGVMVAAVAARDQKHKWEGGHLADRSSWPSEVQERFRVLHEFYGPNALASGNRFGRQLEQEVCDALDLFSGRVLVLGCGSGKEVNYLSRREGVREAFGIDFSPEAIALARSEYPALRRRFLLEDIYNLDIVLSGEFDGIVANAALVHLLRKDDMGQILAKMFARLRLDGIAFIRVIEKRGRQEEMDNHLLDSRRWFVYYTEEELRAFAQAAGFAVESLTRRPHAEHGASGVYWLLAMLRRPRPPQERAPRD